MSDASNAVTVDIARARVMREHRYATDSDQLVSVCKCGVESPTVDIGRHIESLASEAGRQAAEASP